MSQRVVYKYPVGEIPFGQCLNVLNVPYWNPGDDEPSKILKIGIDGSNEICVWIDHPYPFRGTSSYTQIELNPTGMTFDGTSRKHIDSVITPSGLVWHYYQIV
jgi:hypothetical protein